jgi:cell division protease FtsH
LPLEDIYSHSKSDLLTDIAKAMGGRAAEDIKFGQFTTGASNDIKQATEMARAMVCRYGMSRLGPINFGQKSENPFLGRDIGESRNFSESVAHEIDREVSSIINAQYELAKQILIDHMDTFEHVSKLLVELETLDSEEFVSAVRGASIEEIRQIQAAKLDLKNSPEQRPGAEPMPGTGTGTGQGFGDISKDSDRVPSPSPA